MKKIIIVMVLGVMLTSGVASAQTDSNLPSAGITPGNPLYFLERIFENVGTFFTFNDSAKVQRYLALSEERLAEAKVLAEKGDEKAQDLIADFEEQFEKATEKAERIEDIDLNSVVIDATTKHIAVLDDVLNRVPEQARINIQAAKERVMSGQIEALRGLSQKDPEKTVDILTKAVEGRLRVVEDQLVGEGDDYEVEALDLEESFGELNEYAEFGKEIYSLTEDLQSNENEIETLIKRATSRYIDVLKDVQSRVPAEAREEIQKVIDSSERAEKSRSAIPIRPQSVRSNTGKFNAGGIIPKERPWSTPQDVQERAPQILNDDQQEEMDDDIDQEVPDIEFRSEGVDRDNNEQETKGPAGLQERVPSAAPGGIR